MQYCDVYIHGMGGGLHLDPVAGALYSPFRNFVIIEYWSYHGRTPPRTILVSFCYGLPLRNRNSSRSTMVEPWSYCDYDKISKKEYSAPVTWSRLHQRLHVRFIIFTIITRLQMNNINIKKKYWKSFRMAPPI